MFPLVSQVKCLHMCHGWGVSTCGAWSVYKRVTDEVFPHVPQVRRFHMCHRWGVSTHVTDEMFPHVPQVRCFHMCHRWGFSTHVTGEMFPHVSQPSCFHMCHSQVVSTCVTGEVFPTWVMDEVFPHMLQISLRNVSTFVGTGYGVFLQMSCMCSASVQVMCIMRRFVCVHVCHGAFKYSLGVVMSYTHEMDVSVNSTHLSNVFLSWHLFKS